MSIENVRRFFRAVKSDVKLRDSLKAVKAESFSAAANDVARIASDAGYSFTGEDYEATVRQDLDQKWWRHSQMTPDQERMLGNAATQPSGTIYTGPACTLSTAYYTPCGC